MILPSFLLKVSEGVKHVYETGVDRQEYWYVARYYRFVRGQILLIGLPLLVVGLILVIRYRRHNLH